MENYGLLYKEKMKQETEEKFKASNSFIITTFNNFPVIQAEELRGKLRKVNSRFMVLKNSIARRALKDAKLDDVMPMIDGACAAILTEDEVIDASRVVNDFIKDNESVNIIGGYSAEMGILDAGKIKELASLPSKDALRAQFVGVLKAPINGFHGALSGILRNFVSVLNQLKEKREKSGGE